MCRRDDATRWKFGNEFHNRMRSPTFTEVQFFAAPVCIRSEYNEILKIWRNEKAAVAGLSAIFALRVNILAIKYNATSCRFQLKRRLSTDEFPSESTI